MIQYKIASTDDIEMVMQSRLEMLNAVNNLPEDYTFTEELIANSKEYFTSGNQITVLAIDEKVVGCATMCYIDMIPTFHRPSGKIAHLMNVYTNSQYRRQGIALHILSILINEAKEKGITKISLDATELGRPLYEKLGFVPSDDYMILNVN